jgi:hypothetical protein
MECERYVESEFDRCARLLQTDFVEPLSRKTWFIEPCSTKIWFVEIGSTKIWFVEIGSTKISFIEIGSTKIWVIKIGSTKIWFIEIGSSEIVFRAMPVDTNLNSWLSRCGSILSRLPSWNGVTNSLYRFSNLSIFIFFCVSAPMKPRHRFDANPRR